MRLAVAATPEIEATWVGREIRRLLREEGERPSDVAVLYRSNGQSRPDRGGAARAGHRPPGRRRHAVLRAQGGEGRPRVPEARAEPVRRDQPAAHRQLPAARHRRTRRSSGSRSHARARAAGRCGRRSSGSTPSTTSRAPAREGCTALAGRRGRRAARALRRRRRAPSAVARSVVERVGLLADIDTSAPERSTRPPSGAANVEGCSRRSPGARQRDGARRPTGSPRSSTRSRWTSRTRARTRATS